MIEIITEMLSHVFIQRAILVGILISVCAALLVLKRYSMIGDRTITCGVWNNDNFSSIWNYNTIIYSNSTELQYVQLFY